MLAFAAPIGVSEIYPHTSILREKRCTPIEAASKLPHKLSWVIFQADLPIDFVIALAVKWRGCHNAIYYYLVKRE
jgi:hypothetical protein